MDQTSHLQLSPLCCSLGEKNNMSSVGSISHADTLTHITHTQQPMIPHGQFAISSGLAPQVKHRQSSGVATVLELIAQAAPIND